MDEVLEIALVSSLVAAKKVVPAGSKTAETAGAQRRKPTSRPGIA